MTRLTALIHRMLQNHTYIRVYDAAVSIMFEFMNNGIDYGIYDIYAHEVFVEFHYELIEIEIFDTGMVIWHTLTDEHPTFRFDNDTYIPHKDIDRDLIAYLSNYMKGIGND